MIGCDVIFAQVYQELQSRNLWILKKDLTEIAISETVSVNNHITRDSSVRLPFLSVIQTSCLNIENRLAVC